MLRPMLIVPAFAVACLLVSVPAWAADINAPSRIDAVTVFPDGAQITRTAKVKLDPGSHSIIIEGLPVDAIAESIRVTGTASGKLQLGAVDVRLLSPAAGELTTEQKSLKDKLSDEIEVLSDQRALEDDAIESANQQRAYLANLIELPTQPETSGTAPMDWNGLFTTLSTRLNETNKALGQAKLRQKQIDRQIAKKTKDMNAIVVEKKPAGGLQQVTVRVSAETAIEATLRVSYQVTSAVWQPEYDARLTSGEKGAATRLTLVRRAVISQSTSEDWDDAEIELSTTRARATTSAPGLAALTVDYSVTASNLALPSAAAPNEAKRSQFRFNGAANIDKGLLVSSEEMTNADVTSLQATFKVPGRQSIPKGPAKQLVIGSSEADAPLIVRAIPKLTTTAYLYAGFTPAADGAPYLRGQVSLFRDGVFSGKGVMPAAAPGEASEVPFGADDYVKVRYRVVEDKRGNSGILTTSKTDKKNFEASIRNLHTGPVKVRVLDQIPVSSQQDIKVEPAFDTAPNEKDVLDIRGTVLWDLPMKAGEEKKLAFGYTVSWPDGKAVSYALSQLPVAQSPYDNEQLFRFGASTKF